MTEQQQGELNEALIEAAENGHVEVCLFLIEQGANVNATNWFVWTPLHQAARNGHVEVCQLLIERGANVNATNRYGRAPLHYAVRYGYAEACRLLIQAGANVNAIDRDGWTPLHCAVRNGRVEVCRLLIDRGANVNATDNDGHTPLDLAIRNHAVGTLACFYVHRVVDFHQPDHTDRRPWDRLTAEQRETLTKAKVVHQEKIAILQTRGLPIELARLVMSYV